MPDVSNCQLLLQRSLSQTLPDTQQEETKRRTIKEEPYSLAPGSFALLALSATPYIGMKSYHPISQSFHFLESGDLQLINLLRISRV